jgi:glycosyltransferase involved in cell wall biosynthesis
MSSQHPVTVDILMATYNGGKFLAEQLDSLLAQRHRAIRIVISDDGSSDNTTDLLQAYAARDARVCVVNKVRQGGVVANFSKVLSDSDAEYLMFCDQDDVWLEDKVDIMLTALLAHESEVGAATPLLGFSDLTVVKSDLQIDSASFYSGNGFQADNNTDPRYLVWSSTVYGCTTIFNRALADLGKPIPAGLPMHDQWLALLAASAGIVFYVPCQTILYRQHETNVVGARRKNIVQRLASLRKNMGIVTDDVRKCRRQFAAAALLLSSPGQPLPVIFSYHLDHFSGRIAFVRNNVAPFARERTVYALLFSLFFLMSGRGR